MAYKFIIAVKKDDYKRNISKESPLKGELRFGYVAYHKDLLKTDEYCLGGGAYEVDDENKKLILNEKSMDFDEPRFDRVESVTCPKCFEGYEITYTAPYTLLDKMQGVEPPSPINVNQQISAFI